MKTIYLVHRWDSSPEKDWLPWVKTAFEKKGYTVIAPLMPHPEKPEIEAWVSHLSSLVSIVDEETYFIGHSIGCQAIMRYLETINTKIGGAIFVAGWLNLKNLEDAESETIAK